MYLLSYFITSNLYDSRNNVYVYDLLRLKFKAIPLLFLLYFLTRPFKLYVLLLTIAY